MRLIVKIAALFLLAPAFVWANPPQCQTGTLTQYINLATPGCELAGVVYANFKYQANATGGASAITSDQITVTPSIVVPSTGNFTFSAPWSVSGGQSQSSVITYTATNTNGTTSTEALDLTLGTVQITGVGWATVTEITDLAPPNYLLEVFKSCNAAGTCQTQSSASLQFSAFPVLEITEVIDVVSTGSAAEGSTVLKSYETSLNTCVSCT